MSSKTNKKFALVATNITYHGLSSLNLWQRLWFKGAKTYLGTDYRTSHKLAVKHGKVPPHYQYGKAFYPSSYTAHTQGC